MTQLIVFSRECLVYPTQKKDSPYNIYPGVARKLADLRNKRYTLAIASNECIGEWQESTAQELTTGAQFRVKADRWFCDDSHIVKSIVRGRGNALNVESHSQPWLFGPEEPILIRHKTIESTINELKIIANLCGITEAVFCPVTDGKFLHSIRYEKEWQWRSMMVVTDDCWMPGPGMLIYLRGQRTFKPSRCVTIGETADQNFAADRGGFEFVYADDWRADRVKV